MEGERVSFHIRAASELLMGANDTKGIPPAEGPAGEMITRPMCFPGPKGGREKLVKCHLT